jgi:hypothetical protein
MVALAGDHTMWLRHIATHARLVKAGHTTRQRHGGQRSELTLATPLGAVMGNAPAHAAAF